MSVRPKTRHVEMRVCDVLISRNISLPPQSECLQASSAVKSRYITTAIEARLHKSVLVSNSRPVSGGSAEIMDANYAYWVRMAQAKYLSDGSSGEPPVDYT